MLEVHRPCRCGRWNIGLFNLSFLVSKSILISSIIGSIAAGCECAFDGNIPVNKDIVPDKITQLEKQIKQIHLKTLIIGLGNQGKKEKI